MVINDLQRAFFGNILTLQNYGAKIVNINELEGYFARFLSILIWRRTKEQLAK
jgi:hypothetical protein